MLANKGLISIEYPVMLRYEASQHNIIMHLKRDASYLKHDKCGSI